MNSEYNSIPTQKILLLSDKEDKEKTINLIVICVKTIGRLIVVAEILKSIISRISQKNSFSVIHSLPNEKAKLSGNMSERIFLKPEIVLTK